MTPANLATAEWLCVSPICALHFLLFFSRSYNHAKALVHDFVNAECAEC
jgi:hypothetical protein